MKMCDGCGGDSFLWLLIWTHADFRFKSGKSYCRKSLVFIILQSDCIYSSHYSYRERTQRKHGQESRPTAENRRDFASR
jgi:hypothetical protein